MNRGSTISRAGAMFMVPLALMLVQASLDTYPKNPDIDILK